MDNTNGRSDEASQEQGRLFTVQEAISELNRGSEENQETHSDNNGEDDIAIEDSELVNIETRPSSDQVSFGVMIHENKNLEKTREERTEIPPNLCLQGVGMMLQTLNKYLKNSLMSLLILSAQLPWYLTAMYGHITDSGCENPTFRFLLDMCKYYVLIISILSPLLIKLKLDRLSR